MISQELKRIFNKGVKSEVSQALIDYYKSINFYRKAPYQKELVPQEEITETAKKIFDVV